MSAANYPPGAEYAIYVQERRDSNYDSNYAEFVEEYITDSINAIERATLTFHDECPLQAVYEHLTENDVHKLIRLAVVAKRNLYTDRLAPQEIHDCITNAFDCVLSAVEQASKVEADRRGEEGEFHDDGGCDD